MFYKVKHETLGTNNLVIQLYKSEPCLPPNDNFSSKDVLVQEMYEDEFERNYRHLKSKARTKSSL